MIVVDMTQEYSETTDSFHESKVVMHYPILTS